MMVRWRCSLALAVSLLSTGWSARAQDFRVLVFSKTSGFRHDSIADGVQLIQSLGTGNNFAVDVTEDATEFNLQNLLRYRVVVWLNTSGDVLNESQQQAFQLFIRSGNGYVGVHAATDTEYGWPWYGELIGGDAWFLDHPSIQSAELHVEDPNHPSTELLPANGTFTDEWYNFRNNPRAFVDVLVSIDESTYSGGNMGDHPMSWCHEFDGGRSWYTGMGHRPETYLHSGFRQHLLGGILWASRGGVGIPSLPGWALWALVLGALALGTSAIRRKNGISPRPTRKLLP